MAVAAAAEALDDSTERAMQTAAAVTSDILEPVREDITDAALLLTSAVVFLGACVLIHAVSARR